MKKRVQKSTRHSGGRMKQVYFWFKLSSTDVTALAIFF